MRTGGRFWTIIAFSGTFALRLLGGVPDGREANPKWVATSSLTRNHKCGHAQLSSDKKYILRVCTTNDAAGLDMFVMLGQSGEPKIAKVIFRGERGIGVGWSPKKDFFYILETYDPSQSRILVGQVMTNSSDVYWIYQTPKPGLSGNGYIIENCEWSPVSWDLEHGCFTIKCEWWPNDVPGGTKSHTIRARIPIEYTEDQREF